MPGVEPAHPPFPDHPLWNDRGRLERIASNMHAQIQKVLRRPVRETEQVLAGGESADDILQEAVVALLKYDPSRLQMTWEELSVIVARRKAIDAIRRATKGRRNADTPADAPDDISIVSLAVVRADPPDDAEDADPAETFVRTQQQLVLLRLARELLTERDRTIYFGIHYEGRTRAELGKQLGLSGPGVGQIYVRVARSLLDAARQDPSFPTTIDTDRKEDR